MKPDPVTHYEERLEIEVERLERELEETRAKLHQQDKHHARHGVADYHSLTNNPLFAEIEDALL